jgi:plasmid replication initiation protein
MENLTVVHSNKLVEASYNLTIDEIRLIIYASTKIDSRKENIGIIRVYPSEFSCAFNLDKKNTHRNLVNSLKLLASKSVTIQLDNGMHAVYPWLAMGQYKKDFNDSNHILIEFSKYIEPYLFELKNRFTSINFEYAAKLNTPFSFRLYQWLKKIEKLDSPQAHKTKSITLEINWMKTQSQLNGQYPIWKDFKNRVIEPAIDKINSNTDLSVIYEPLKKGRKIYAIKFNFINETESTGIKPIRPRLYRRPKVLKGSHEEGLWMRKNLKLLLQYKTELELYDPKALLNISDLKKIIEYSSNGSSLIHQEANLELKKRTLKRRAP